MTNTQREASEIPRLGTANSNQNSRLGMTNTQSEASEILRLGTSNSYQNSGLGMTNTQSEVPEMGIWFCHLVFYFCQDDPMDPINNGIPR